MASLYKPHYTKLDPTTGERKRRSVRKWYGKYKDANGIARSTPLCEDKQSAQAMLTDIIRGIERENAGIIDVTSKHLQGKIRQQLEGYQAHLESKARSQTHIKETVRLINNLVSECRIQILAELQTADESIEQYLTARRHGGVSYRTVNADLAAIRAFCRWLLQRQRLHRNPTIGLEPLNVAEDRRLERRALTNDESTKLLQTAEESPRIFRRLSGHDRAMIYLLAQRTGLRRNELCSLTPSSFEFSTSPAVVTVEAASSKHRRKDRLPLTNDVATAFQEYLVEKEPSKQIWQSSWWQKSAEMIRHDLQDAGIPIKDAQGRVLDFHGLRMTFITGLSRAGVAPAIAQKLARHSDINLTMGVYTELEMQELGHAVTKLPKLSTSVGSSTEVELDSKSQLREEQFQELEQAWKKLSDETRLKLLTLAGISQESGN